MSGDPTTLSLWERGEGDTQPRGEGAAEDEGEM